MMTKGVALTTIDSSTHTCDARRHKDQAEEVKEVVQCKKLAEQKVTDVVHKVKVCLCLV